MSVQDRIFSLAAKVVKIISLKNVAIWTFAALVVILGYAFFEKRTEIVSYIVNGPVSEAPGIASFGISDTSKNRIKQIVDIDELISAIIVANVDIRNNRRIALHWYSDDTSLQKSIDALFANKYGGIPLFTSDEKNNETIVSIINGEFSCNSYKDGGNAGVFPGLENRLPYICRAPLPPYYGQFSGYVTLSLNRVPTADELTALKAETINISTEIYFRDVLPSSQKVLASNSTQPRGR